MFQIEINSLFNSKEAIDFLSKNKCDLVFLDHDLGGKDNGMIIVKWIVENKPDIKFIVVHSMNIVAAENMISLLSQAKYNCVKINFYSLSLDLINKIINEL